MDRFLIPRKVLGVEQQQSTRLADEKKRAAKRKLSEAESDNNETIDCDVEKTPNDEERNSSSSSNDENESKKKKKKGLKKKEKRSFRPAWLRDYPWVTNRDNKPFCKICQKSLAGGQTHLQRHETREYHRKRIAATSQTVALDVMARENPKLKAASEAKSSALKLAILLTEHNLPFKLLEHLTKILPSLCPDSEIAKQITCSRTKGRGLIVDVLAPASMKQAAEKLSTAKFSLIIDETTDISTTKCLAIIARYFDDSTNDVRDRCLGLLEVPSCTAADLYASITKFLAVNNIPLQNMIGFAADNASVMMGNLNGVQAKFREVLPNLFVMGCVCHSFHLCASAACLKLPRTIEDLARDIYSYFSHSCKRLVKFTSPAATESNAMVIAASCR